MSEQPIFVTRDLVRVFGRGPSEVRAVDHVDLAIPAGQRLGIVGESGSGKSTLARMLLRLMPVTSGTITYLGKDVKKAKVSLLWLSKNLSSFRPHFENVHLSKLASHFYL